MANFYVDPIQEIVQTSSSAIQTNGSRFSERLPVVGPTKNLANAGLVGDLETELKPTKGFRWLDKLRGRA